MDDKAVREALELLHEHLQWRSDINPRVFSTIRDHIEAQAEYVREADRRVGEQFNAAQREKAEYLRLLNRFAEDCANVRAAESRAETAERRCAELVALIEKWRGDAKSGTFTSGSGAAYREALNECADELHAALTGDDRHAG